MAAIFKRVNKDKTEVWRAMVRLKGHDTECNHFDTQAEAIAWANAKELEMRTKPKPVFETLKLSELDEKYFNYHIFGRGSREEISRCHSLPR